MTTLTEIQNNLREGKQLPPEENKRTIRQNAALHLYFQLVADALNSAGLDMRKTLSAEIEIPWSKESVKEYLWRPVQETQLGKQSTKELTTKDIDIIYDTINRFLAEKGLHVSFPSIEELMIRELKF